MEIRYIEDYYDKIKEHFPEVEESDIKKIVNYGMKSFYLHNLYGADVLLKSKYFTLYSGKMFSSNLVFYHYWRIKYKIKFRIKYKRRKERYNGQYYFGLTDGEYEDYVNQLGKTGKRRRKITFKKLYVYKILDECLLDRGKKHFFSMDYPDDIGFTYYWDEYITRHTKYIYKRNKNNEIEPI